MRAHPAGPLHAGILAPPETAGPRPLGAGDLDALAPAVWPRGAARAASGAVEIAGVDVRDLAEEYGTPLFVIDEADFRSRAARVRRLLRGLLGALRGQGVPLHRGGALGRRRRPFVGRLQRRRAGRRAAGGLPRRADRVARQQQIDRRARRGRRGGRRPGGARLVPRDRPAGRGRPGARRRRARDDQGDGRRRGAHPRVHRHRARRPEVRLRAAPTTPRRPSVGC